MRLIDLTCSNVDLSAGGGNGGNSGAVTSVFGRDGIVVAEQSDYNATQIDYDNSISSLSATNTQDAINELSEREQSPSFATFVKNNYCNNNSVLKYGYWGNSRAFQWVIQEPLNVKRISMMTGRWNNNVNVTIEVRSITINSGGLSSDLNSNSGTLLQTVSFATGSGNRNHFDTITTDIDLLPNTLVFVVFKSSTGFTRQGIQVELEY